jgi:hypothetical protein
MFRRTFAITAFVILALACTAAPASALGILWAQDVDSRAQLATATRGPIAAWKAPGVGVDSVQAVQYTRNDPGVTYASTLLSSVAGLSDWFVAGDGAQNVTVVWKAGGAVYAKRVDLGSGATLYGPVTVCTDAAVADDRGSGSTAALTGATGDGAGGVWVWCTASPTSTVNGVGDTLLNHVSSTGVVARPDPGVAVAKGTVRSLAVDSVGHAVVLLGSPGRNGLAVQRYSTSGTADWAGPSTPYNPLLPPPPTTTQEPLGVTAGANALIAWREGARVKTQRFSLSGSRLWLTPGTVTMAGAVKLADDGQGGCYLTGPSGTGIVVRHLTAGGAQAAGSPSALPTLGLPDPRVDAVAADRAGDLTVAYSDVHSAGMPGVARMTCLGVWDTASPTSIPEFFTAAAHNGAGGAYALGGGGAAELLHFAEAAASVTLRPRTQLVQYGKTVTVGGYVAGGGVPVESAEVQVRRVVSGGTAAGATDTTDAHGYYEVSLKPKANAVWTAVASGAAREEQRIRVMPKVTLSLSHLKPAGTRLVEVFSGSVAPRHKGTRMLVQKAVGSKWRTVASGRLDSRSRYRISWRLPYRTATYKIRVVIPAHADHAEGASSPATLRVVVKKG